MFGPGQTETGAWAGAMPRLMRAPLPSWSQMQDFTYTACTLASGVSAGGALSIPMAVSFWPWYSLEAVQMGLSVNSVLETRNFFGQGEPGLPSAICFLVHCSEVELRRLLKTTPSGLTSLR